MGGRAKSEKLSGYSLRELVRTKAFESDSRFIKRIDAQLYSMIEDIEEIIRVLKAGVSWFYPDGGIRVLLQEEYPDYYDCFPDFSQDADGFTTTGQDGKSFRKDELWKRWINGDLFPSFLRNKLDDSCPAEFEDIWDLPHGVRLQLKTAWETRVLAGSINELRALMKTYGALLRDRDAIRQWDDLRILDDARVIGATTTGAANFKDLLGSKAAGVIIIEEAGEVLESHVLSALQADSTKHFIMIGDHKQLRPKVENYSLSTVSGNGYDLDCSLFERLVLSNLPSTTLNVQHRMRPEISQSIRSQTYPKLEDHCSVREFPHVKGVTKDVVFINHQVLEDDADTNDEDPHLVRTKSNSFEAQLAVEIVRFLLLQGYAPSRIAILTPYLGQLMSILKKVKDRLPEAIS